MVKNSKFFQTFGPPCRSTLADLDGSTPECAQVCALHIEPHLATRRKIEMVAVHCTNETTPHFFEFLTPPPPAPQGPMVHRGGRGTSADIVPTHIKFGVDPCTRCWDIAQKPSKCKNSPLTPIVAKISFPPFSAPWGPLTPKGERHIWNQSTPTCKIWRESAHGIAEKSLTKKRTKKQKTKTNIQ